MDLQLHDALNGCAAGSRWYDGAGPLAICDAVRLPGLSRPAWLLFARAGSALYFCPLAQDARGAWQDVGATGFYQREVLGWLQRHGSAVTAGGGRIAFDSALDFARCELLRADTGGSSNTVSRLDCGGVPAMHKLYRKLEIGQRESDATVRLDRAAPGLVPRCLGSYRYSAPTGETYALGLLTEFVPGHGLYQDLSASLRSLWSLEATAAGGHIAALLPGLHGWRAFIERLHAAMAAALPCAPRFDIVDMGGLCAEARERIARIRPQLLDDALLDDAARARFLRIFDALERQVLVPQALRAAPCHGDLHLSHLLWDGEDQRRIIDLSPPPAGHPLQDWVALERALEYFCLDEAALELAPHAGLAQEELMRAFLGGLPDNPAIRTRMALLERWHRAVREALCGEHLAGSAHAVTYAARLLQELDYNYSHRRPYYRCIDFVFLAQHVAPLIGE